MSKILTFIIFITIGTLIISAIHYFLWLRLIRDTGLTGFYRNMGTTLAVLLAISFPISAFVARLVPYKFSLPILWISYLWLGLMMLLFFALLVPELIKLLVFLKDKLFTGDQQLPVDPARREFLARSIAAAVSILVLGSAAFGVKKYLTAARVNRIQIALGGLPEIFKGFRIVQISDLHIGQLMTGAKLAEIVEQVNALRPDLIAITGDLADGSAGKLFQEVQSLRKLQAGHGVYFVTGNHEYYSGVDAWVDVIRNMGIRVLHNEHVKISKADEFIYLAGVPDHEAKSFGESYAADFKKTLGDLEADKKKILLAHQPVATLEAAEFGTDLVLSGHTHGGQIWPFTYLVYLQQPYLKGMYQHKGTTLYVNQGTGCWGPPMRLGSYNEITEITLV